MQAGPLALHPREPADLAGPDGRHLGLDGREAAVGPGGRHPLRADPAAPGPGPGDAVQRPRHRAAGLHAPTTRRSRRPSTAPRPRARPRCTTRSTSRSRTSAKQKKAGELRRRAIVLLSDGEDTASLVSDEQVLELARKTEINIYAISLRAEPPPGPQPAEVQPGRPPADRAHPGHRRPGPLPQLALRARRGLRPHRRGAAHAVQPGLRVEQQAPRREVAPHRGARARRARTCRSATSSATSPPRSDATRSPPTDPSDPDHAFVSGIIRTAQRVARRLRLV